MSHGTSHATPHQLLQTGLHDLHTAAGGRMVAFAGYDMPLHYTPGILKEHLHVRQAAGAFDVSHMGQIKVTAKSGRFQDAAIALERLVPSDILGLADGRQKYGLLTSETGGMRDDIMLARRGEHLVLVVNAACKLADYAYLHDELGNDCDIEWIDCELIALQGPKAESVLTGMAPACSELRFMDVRDLEILGRRCRVTRSGYTGEDGFEISVPRDHILTVFEALLKSDDVQPIGLGARNTLRLEAGLCLYGSDLDGNTSPVEAGLTWAIAKARRSGGTRAGGFPGAARILDEIDTGTARLRVGLKSDGRLPVRDGAQLFESPEGTDSIATVTSGAFGPSLNAPIAMAYVPKRLAEPGTELYAEVRGKRVPVTVAAMPFIQTRYKRALTNEGSGDRTV